MHRIYTADDASSMDKHTIEEIGIPSYVLMERAALSVTREIEEHITSEYSTNGTLNKKTRILCLVGRGNNGGDAVAVGRQLREKGFSPDIFIIEENNLSKDLKIQISIARKLGLTFIDEVNWDSYDIIIDGIFGNGLSRDIDGYNKEIVERVNKSRAWVISIDVPSGLDASRGSICGVCIKADVTVTFGRERLGTCIYPGVDYVGRLVVADIGFDMSYEERLESNIFLLDDEDLKLIPKRSQNSNKGTFGKVLIVAGSKNMGGAAILSAKAVLKTGAGLVKIYTHESNRASILASLPEVIVLTYSELDEKGISKDLEREVEIADSIVIGPGLSTSETAINITKYILLTAKSKLIIDADAINILSLRNDLVDLLKNSSCKRIIMTPHIKEMSRISGISVEEILYKRLDIAKTMANSLGVDIILKDSTSLITDGKISAINGRVNSGMATPGTGDVLTGMLAGIASQGCEGIYISLAGVYLHSCCGYAAKKRLGEYSMLASDIVNGLADVLK